LSAEPAVPPAPDVRELDPLIHEWKPREPIVRCHDSRFGASEFNRTASEGRFRPVRSGGRILGTIYGAQDDAGAIAETLFRGVPVRASFKAIRRARLAPVMISVLLAKRSIRLASLHGNGLQRVGATAAELIDSEADQYPALTPWGQALHDCPAQPDGIVWRSRHYDDSYAFILFGDRVRRNELTVVSAPLPLAVGRGLDRVMELAEQAGIAIIE
jgi:RES domain